MLKQVTITRTFHNHRSQIDLPSKLAILLLYFITKAITDGHYRLNKSVRSDLDPNSLQRLSADDRSQQSISHEYEGALHWVTLYVGVMF